MTDTGQTWLQETVTLLRNAPRELTLTQIAKDCDVSIAWLSKLSNGKLDNPAILMVERVNKYLKTAHV